MAILEGNSSSSGRTATSTKAGSKKKKSNVTRSANLGANIGFSSSKRGRSGDSLGSSLSKGIGHSVGNAAKAANAYGKAAGSHSANSRSGNGGYSGYSSGRSGGGGYTPSGSSIGSNSSGTIAPTVKPAAPRISKSEFLADDTTYKAQQSAYQKAINDYLAQYEAEQQKYNTEYTAGIDKLGLERTQGAEALKDDYAGRGLLTSGVYADALNEFNTGYDTRLADMERAKTNYLDDLLTGKQNYQEEQKLMLQKAKQDAINRYMSSVGV